MRNVTKPLVLALALSACGGRGEVRDPGPSERTVLEVDNQSTLDVTVYVLPEGGSRVRLGMATAHLRSEFTIPERLLFGITSLRFQADPVGSRGAPVTQSIAVSAGQTVVLTIPPFLMGAGPRPAYHEDRARSASRTPATTPFR